MAENPLVSLGELTKPINTLVEKASDAVGGLFRPWQTRRVARAEADAALVGAENEIQITDLHKQAFWRFIEEEAAKQSNMENIVLKAIPGVDQDNAKPEDIQRDWFANLFDKCRIVSDEDMQNLSARILAGEANNPGRFSRKTVNLVADLDKSDASLFVSLCGFVWMLAGNPHPLIFDTQHDIYNRQGINFVSIGDLESLGLVRVNSLTGFKIDPTPPQLRVSYHGKRELLTISNNSKSEFSIGIVMFTQPGRELSRVCEASPANGFFEYVYERWASESLVPTRTS